MDSVTLQSSDGKKFEIDRDTVKYFGLIDDMLKNIGEDGFGNENDAIKLGQVDSILLDKVLKWACHRKNEERNSEKEANFENDFITENSEYLYELINTANYLGFDDLLQSLCRSVAMKMKNKTTEQIRIEFEIE